ncbi:PorP/SprF family type IX secretion system membrane protein [Algibacter sp. R77976]|uniref:PorP/SprF family type IX secretion system membrane protein n=1 Tax=Algibacter sp. R77976 TaxID=3093873 RepID=UPI0037CC73AE
MKKYILHIVLFFCIAQQLYSQEDGVVAFNMPVRNSLKFNRQFINPTFSFVREQNKYISFNNKREWVQFDNAPQTYLFGYSGRFQENIGAGVSLYQQNYGVLSTFGGIVNFAYNAVLDRDSNLTFGTNLAFYKSGLNRGDVIIYSEDSSLDNVPSTSIITINPGVNYGTEFFDFGVSLKNIVSYNLTNASIIEDDPEKGIQAHIMYTGYMNNRGFFDESRFSGLISSEFRKDQTVVSGMVMLMVPKGVWAQAGYNSLYAMSVGIGLNISPQIALEYNYEKGVGGFSTFGNSHDITIAYKFKNDYQYDYSGDDDEESLLISSKNKNRRVVKRRKSSKSRTTKKIEPDVVENIDANSDIDAEAARIKTEEEAQVRLVEEARVKAVQAEQARVAEAARIKAEEEAQAKLAEEARIKAVQAEQARVAEAARIKSEEEAQAKLAEEARVKAVQAEQARVAETARIKSEEEAQTKLAEEARVKAVQAEQARVTEAARIKAEEEAQAKLAEEARVKAVQAEQARVAEAARIKAEEEAQAKLAEEARVKAVQEEQARVAEAARIKAEEEAQAKLAEAARIKAEEEAQAKLAEEARVKAVQAEQARVAEAARIKTEEEAQAKLAEEARVKAVQAEQARVAEVAKIKAEEEAQAKLAEEARVKAVQAEQARVAEAARIKSEEEAQAKLSEEARVKAVQAEQARVAEASRIKKEEEAQAKLAEEARVKAVQAEQARVAEAAKIKSEEEAQAKLVEEARVKAVQAEQARVAEAARIKSEEEAQAKLAEEARVKAVQAEQARVAEAARIKSEEEEAQAKLAEEARVKAVQAEQARVAEVARVKAEEEAQAKLAEEARVKAVQAEQARVAEAAKIKAEEEAQAKLAEEARVKAVQAEQARVVEAARIKAEEAAKAKLAEETKIKAEKELQIDEIPLDEVLIKFKKSNEASNNAQQVLFKKLNDKVAVKQQDLDDLKKENDLSEKGIVSAPKAFKSVSAENAEIESLKLKIDNSIELGNTKIAEIETLYKDRLKRVKDKNDAVNIEYAKTIEKLKSEQLQAKNIKQNLTGALNDIKLATDFERNRRIKRAAYDNDDDRYSKDRAALASIKKFTEPSTEPLTKDDFDYGEPLSNIQIVKDVNHVEEGYYLVVAVHNDVSKRDEFLRKAVASGEKDINFFFDVNTSKYYIYYEKFNNISQAKNVLDTNKGNKPFNGKMAMVKIEN